MNIKTLMMQDLGFLDNAMQLNNRAGSI